MSENRYEVVFSRRCIPQSRIVRADRYEVREGILGKEIVFLRDGFDYVVDRESVDDVKAIHVVEQEPQP